MKKGGLEDKDKASDNPFAALAAFRASLPAGPAPAATQAPAPAAANAQPAKKGPAKAVVRLEKKGRGGKEVTLVEQLGLAPAVLETWLKDLKNALGCGGVVEGEAIVLQGDLRKRLPAVLEARGVRQVKVG